MDTFGERELVTARVSHGKREGRLVLTTKKLVFVPLEPTGTRIRVNFSEISDQKVSRPENDRVMMKVETNSSKKGFIFTFKGNKSDALSERNDIRDALLQARHGEKMAAKTELKENAQRKKEIEKLARERALLLASHSDARAVYERLVRVGKLDEDTFWEGQQPRLHALRVAEKSRGVPSTVIGDIQASSQANLVRYRLTPAIKARLFEEYPSLAEAFDGNVPEKLSEREFWQAFFRSRYFYRDADDEMGVFALASTKDDSIGRDRKRSRNIREDGDLWPPGYGIILDETSRTIGGGVGFATNRTGEGGEHLRRFNSHSEFALDRLGIGVADGDGGEGIWRDHRTAHERHRTEPLKLGFHKRGMEEYMRSIVTIAEEQESEEGESSGIGTKRRKRSREEESRFAMRRSLESIENWDLLEDQKAVESALDSYSKTLAKGRGAVRGGAHTQLSVMEDAVMIKEEKSLTQKRTEGRGELEDQYGGPDDSTAVPHEGGTEASISSSEDDFMSLVYDYFLKTNELLRFVWIDVDGFKKGRDRPDKRKSVIVVLSEIYDELRQALFKMPVETRGKQSKYLTRFFRCIDAAIAAHEDTLKSSTAKKTD